MKVRNCNFSYKIVKKYIAPAPTFHLLNSCFIGSSLCIIFFLSLRNGTLRARKVEEVGLPEPEKYQGVVCSMKENFGFIERSDVVKEIFFHYSEYKGDINELLLGDDVEFQIQSRTVSIFLFFSSH